MVLKIKNNLVIILILTLAFVLRVWGLDKVPPELFGDELDVGYHAYSLLKTAKDYYGQFLPTYIHSFSEWRAPLLMYVTIPFVAIFGLNEWGVRLPPAIFGVFSVFLIYLITKETIPDAKFNSKRLRLEYLAAFFLAISPWHIHYSRAAFEVSLLLFLILLATLFLLKAFRNRSFFLVSAVIFPLCFYTYSTANLFIPLFILLILFVYKSEIFSIDKRILFGAFTIFVLISIPIIYQILIGHVTERFSNFSIFSDQEIVREINFKRSISPDSTFEVLIHNKPIYWFKKALTNYLSAFSPQFLFISGDVTFRHSIHSLGEIYLTFLPLIIIGAYFLLKSKAKDKYFWLGWLFIAPIPSSLTKDGALHATRLILMLPPIIILSAIGAKSLWQSSFEFFLSKLIFWLFLLFLLCEFGFYLHEYWAHYPKESWRWWHMGYKQSIQFMKSKEKEYDLIVFNNTYEPSLIRFLFWWRYTPLEFMQEFSGDKEKTRILPGFNGFSLGDRYYFGTAKDYPQGVIGFIKPGMLYLVSQRDEVGGDWDWEVNPPNGIKVLKTVRNPFGEPIFYVVTGS